MTVAESEPTIGLGIDVGGTFTDVVTVGGGRTVRGKVPSTPANPAAGVVAACEFVAGEMGLELSGLLRRLHRFGLGTTVVTNVLATRSGRKIGLVTTKGFEDLIPLARGTRICDDGWLVPPPPLVDRTCILGVAERTDREGQVIRAVDPDDAVAAARALVESEGVEALVVSLLWSFRNPANEQAVAAVVAAKYPDLPIVLGSDLAPVIREYERTQFALLNAYVGGALDWLTPLADELRAQGLTAPLVLTHSSGGATTVEGATAVPIGLAQSGPAAGAAAATQLARSLGEADVVTCDLGGTSLDVALLSGGEALRRTRGAILGHWTSLSMVDVDSVGSGGGSIAWVDPVGAIRVGPRSAGADPGPACYGRGGTEATVTDALVVLGAIDPVGFLGGRMPLDAERAREVCTELGERIGLGTTETAWGIREVALAVMARAVRTRIASRGLAAADLTLLAYGGCGGLFAGDIARDVGARRTVVPELAPVFSAFGAATAALHRERALSVALRLPCDPELLRSTLTDLAALVDDDLAADDVSPAERVIRFEADVRFERQGAELTVPVGLDAGGRTEVDGLATRFVDEYVRRFGEGAVALGVAVEVMTLRAVGTAVDLDAVEPGPPAEAGPELPAVPDDERAVQIHRVGPPSWVAVHRREGLSPGSFVRGPAIVDAGDTTVWVADGHTGRVDAAGSLIIEAETEAS